MIVGVNLRTTMVDKDEALFNDQNDLLYQSGVRSIFFADDDDEYDWFVQQNGHWYRDRLYHWWLDRGSEVLVPIANSNVGVEKSVPADVWKRFLDKRRGWATMARKDLITAILRTKHSAGWNWLLSDAARIQREMPKGVIGVIGGDMFLLGTDAWLPNVRRTSSAKLTAEGKSQFEQLGRIYDGDPFAEFSAEVGRIWSGEIISDACFVYDHGNGPRAESKSGDVTQNVVEFGVVRAAQNWRSKWDAVVKMIADARPRRALAHTAIDPSEAWRWKEKGGTKALWTYSGYASLKSKPHELTLWPTREGRQALRDALALLGSGA